MPFDKELLFKSRLHEAEVEVPGVGTVRVRGLSRAEVLLCQNVAEGEGQAGAFERKLLAMAMVDPELTEAEVGAWQKASTAFEMEPVTLKVQELSGLNETVAKEALKEVMSDPDVEFRVPSGEGPGNDGGSTTGGDV